MEKMLSAAKVAEQLDVPEKTLADWRSRGLGPAYARIGRHVRYRPEDLERWVRSRVERRPGVRRLWLGGPAAARRGEAPRDESRPARRDHRRIEPSPLVGPLANGQCRDPHWRRLRPGRARRRRPRWIRVASST